MWWTQPQTPLHGLARSAFQPSHCFQLKQLPCKHMGSRWVFLFSCRSRVLNNIQKDSATYHPVLAKIWSPSFFPFFPTFSPPQFGKSTCRWKGTDTQWCNLEKVWRAVIKVIEQTGKRVSMEQGGQRPPYGRSQEETIQIQWPVMQHKAQALMWRMTYSDWYVLADPNALIPCLSFLKLNKQCVTRSSTYHPSATVCVRVSVCVRNACVYGLICESVCILTVCVDTGRQIMCVSVHRNVCADNERAWMCVTCL